MTREAMVLKQMRVGCGLSMKKAGELMGKSDSYIAHLETGRMDIPKGEKLVLCFLMISVVRTSEMMGNSSLAKAEIYGAKYCTAASLRSLVRRFVSVTVSVGSSVACSKKTRYSLIWASCSASNDKFLIS